METSRDFFELIFLNVVGQLLNHVYHQQKKATIQYIMCTYEAGISIRDLVQEEVVSIADGINTLVSILHRNDHFVEMVVDIASKSVTVFDGLNVVRHNGDTTLSWGPNAIYMLKKANLIPYDKVSKFRAVKTKDKRDQQYECVTSTGTFSLAMGFFVQQKDGHNCGPIAVCKVMDLFGVKGFSLPKNHFEKKRYRKIVCECYRRLVQKCDSNLEVVKRKDSKTDWQTKVKA
jgi:hypothetical protein